MGDVLVRTEAGPSVGLGHLQRCLALAHALRALSVNCVFAVSGGADARARAEAAGARALAIDRAIGTAVDVAATLRAARKLQARALIVDSYRADGDYLALLRRGGALIAAIDDLAACAFAAHLVVNGGVTAPSLAYRSRFGDTRFLLGPRFSLLRPGFARARPRSVRSTVRHVLVTLGGSGSPGLLARVLRWLEPFDRQVSVSVVRGPYMSREPGSSRPAARMVDAPASLHPWLREADLAISGGGLTLYELAAAGIPAVAIELAENQRENVRGLAAAGTLAAAGRAGDAGFDEAGRRAVGRLLRDAALRRRMSAAGQRLIDGQGARRVAGAIAAAMRGIRTEGRGARRGRIGRAAGGISETVAGPSRTAMSDRA